MLTQYERKLTARAQRTLEKDWQKTKADPARDEALTLDEWARRRAAIAMVLAGLAVLADFV